MPHAYGGANGGGGAYSVESRGFSTVGVHTFIKSTLQT